ncbi:MAG: hypothetical protein AAF740_07870 [Bacteroidota bacterium]
MNEEILDENQLQSNGPRRRALLPIWIKVFIWIFLVMGALIPVAAVLGLLGFTFGLSIYGLESNAPLSLTGLIVMSIFSLKGAVAFGLWTEKRWAAKLALVDAAVGLFICVLVSMLPFVAIEGNFISIDASFRLEILFLLPYLLVMRKIAPEWEKREDK